MNDENFLIEGLVGKLEPVRPFERRMGWTLVSGAFVLTVGVVALAFGFRPGLLEGRMSELFVLASGLILLLGISTASAAIMMANPRVGAAYDGPRWAMASLGLLPLSVILAWVAPRADQRAMMDGLRDWHCALDGTLLGGLVAIALFTWLRRGAPVAPERAGMFAGVAAGALGAFGNGLACPWENLAHIGALHVAPIIVLGVAGRFLGARLIRW